MSRFAVLLVDGPAIAALEQTEGAVVVALRSPERCYRTGVIPASLEVAPDRRSARFLGDGLMIAPPEPGDVEASVWEIRDFVEWLDRWPPPARPDPPMPARPPANALKAIETVRGLRSWTAVEMYAAIREACADPAPPAEPPRARPGAPPVQG